VKKIEIGWRLWSLIVFFLISIGFLGFSYAYGGNNPKVSGHSLTEVGIPLCSENQILMYNSSNDLACGEIGSASLVGSYVLGNTSHGYAFKTYCPEGYVMVGLDFRDNSDDHSGSKAVCMKLQ
jgi:hypothetical protein